MKALAAVELQLPSGLLFSQCIADGVEYKAHGLIGSGVYASHGYERSHVDGVKNTFELLKAYLG